MSERAGEGCPPGDEAGGEGTPVDSDAPLSAVEEVEPSPFARFRASRHRQWDVVLAVAVGGGVGSVGRYLVGTALPARPGGLPWGTFAANVAGSFALGFLMVMILDVWPPTRYLRPVLCIGLLGGFTTFSTMALETRQLAADGHLVLADSYAMGTLVAGLVAVWSGIALARVVAGLPVRRTAHTRDGAPR